MNSSKKVILAWPYKINKKYNPYNYNLYSNFENKVIEFKKQILKFRIDIFHIHWPETYLSEKNIIKYILGNTYILILIVTYKLLNKKIIWTVHNIEPHESKFTFLNKIVYKFLFKLVDKFIVLNKRDYNILKQKNKNVKIIRHGMSLITMSEYNKIKKNQFKYILCFGTIKKYKNIEILIKNFKKYYYEGYTLKIIGKSFDEKYLELLKSISVNNKDIEIIDKHLSENELKKLIINSECVVIPYSKNNSGVLFKSIELRTSVITIKSDITIEIKELTENSIISIQNFKDKLNIDKCEPEKFDSLIKYDWKNISKKTESFILN